MQAESKLRDVFQESPIETESEAYASLVANSKCILGECILWDQTSQHVWWTDINGCALFRMNIETGVVEKIAMPKMVGGFCFTTQPNILLLGWEDGFQLYDWVKRESVGDYSQGEVVNPAGLPSRLNDGRCDPSGDYFVCGAYFGHLLDCKVNVFSVSWDGQERKLSHKPIIQNIQITNSLAFTDGRMFFCDSPTRLIQVFAYKNGQIDQSSMKEVYSWQGVGFPDGSCVDSEGFLWSCIWREGDGPGRVQRIDPSTGLVVFVVHMPDTTSQCTCCCFGGSDLDVMFISTASIERDLSREPNAGGVYAVKLPFKGKQESRFKLE